MSPIYCHLFPYFIILCLRPVTNSFIGIISPYGYGSRSLCDPTIRMDACEQLLHMHHQPRRVSATLYPAQTQYQTPYSLLYPVRNSITRLLLVQNVYMKSNKYLYLLERAPSPRVLNICYIVFRISMK